MSEGIAESCGSVPLSNLFFFVVFFVIVFCLIELFHAFPQFRYYTVSALIVVIGFPVGTETDILPPSFYIDTLK